MSEAAAHLGTTRSAIHHWITHGQLPARRAGGALRLPLGAVLNLTTARKEKAEQAKTTTASVDEARTFVKCRWDAVVDLIRAGKVPHVLVDGTRRIPWPALQSYAANEGPRVKGGANGSIRLGDLEERLEAAGLVLNLDAPVWAELVYKVLPERYARPAAPEDATDALPGSERKITVLENRQGAGMGLWNRGDAQDREGVALTGDRVEGVGLREVLERDVRPTGYPELTQVREPRLFSAHRRRA